MNITFTFDITAALGVMISTGMLIGMIWRTAIWVCAQGRKGMREIAEQANEKYKIDLVKIAEEAATRAAKTVAADQTRLVAIGFIELHERTMHTQIAQPITP